MTGSWHGALPSSHYEPNLAMLQTCKCVAWVASFPMARFHLPFVLKGPTFGRRSAWIVIFLLTLHIGAPKQLLRWANSGQGAVAPVQEKMAVVDAELCPSQGDWSPVLGV